MADAVGLAASVLTLVSAAYKSCKTLSDIFASLQDAPGHVVAVADDLEDFCLVLGTLQGALNDEESAAGVIEPAMSGHLSQVLRHCVEIFRTTSLIVGEYDDRNRSLIGLSAWQRLKWTFKEKELEDARKELGHCKMTLNMAISVANWYNLRTATAIASRIESTTLTTETAVSIIRDELAAYVQELETKLPTIMEQVEDTRVLQEPLPPQHDSRARAMVKEDFHFALRHYLDDAVSICSDFSSPSSPSFQVSSFQATDSLLTTIYQTARTRWTSEPEKNTGSSSSISLFINAMGRTVLIRISPDSSVRHLIEMIDQSINLPNTEFDLIHRGCLVSESSTLIATGISHNEKLSCHFKHKRPLTPEPTVKEVRRRLSNESIGTSTSRNSARAPKSGRYPPVSMQNGLLQASTTDNRTTTATIKRSASINSSKTGPEPEPKLTGTPAIQEPKATIEGNIQPRLYNENAHLHVRLKYEAKEGRYGAINELLLDKKSDDNSSILKSTDDSETSTWSLRKTIDKQPRWHPWKKHHSSQSQPEVFSRKKSTRTTKLLRKIASKNLPAIVGIEDGEHNKQVELPSMDVLLAEPQRVEILSRFVEDHFSLQELHNTNHQRKGAVDLTSNI